jgi:hypothetical protein
VQGTNKSSLKCRIVYLQEEGRGKANAKDKIRIDTEFICSNPCSWLSGSRYRFSFCFALARVTIENEFIKFKFPCDSLLVAGWQSSANYSDLTILVHENGAFAFAFALHATRNQLTMLLSRLLRTSLSLSPSLSLMYQY